MSASAPPRGAFSNQPLQKLGFLREGANSPVTIALGLVAVTLATTNVVGGFVVTDRMLEMFKGRQPAAKTPADVKK